MQLDINLAVLISSLIWNWNDGLDADNREEKFEKKHQFRKKPKGGSTSLLQPKSGPPF